MATLFCLQKNVCVKDRMKGMWLKSRKQKNGFLSLRYVSAFQRYQESIKYIATRENAQVNYHHWKNSTSLSLLMYGNCSRKDTRKMLMQSWVLLLPRIYLYLDAPKIKRFAIFTICAGGEKRTRVHFAGSCTVPFARSGYCFTGTKPESKRLVCSTSAEISTCFWQANKTLSRNSSSAERLW